MLYKYECKFSKHCVIGRPGFPLQILHKLCKNLTKCWAGDNLERENLFVPEISGKNLHEL